jgi:hypothetical protein
MTAICDEPRETQWRCCGCGAVSETLMPHCGCTTRLMYDPNNTKRIEHVRWHEWTEVGDRRWCSDCGSFQIRTKSLKWRDTMIGPYPAYSKTDSTMHRDAGLEK